MALPPHIPLAIKMLPHLIQCAIEQRTTNYEELAQATGLEPRVFSRPLVFIRDFVCPTHNLPPLTVLVVRKGAPTASSSFDPIQFAALNITEYRNAEKKSTQAVFDFPHWENAVVGLMKLYGDC